MYYEYHNGPEIGPPGLITFFVRKKDLKGEPAHRRREMFRVLDWAGNTAGGFLDATERVTAPAINPLLDFDVQPPIHNKPRSGMLSLS